MCEQETKHRKQHPRCHEQTGSSPATLKFRYGVSCHLDLLKPAPRRGPLLAACRLSADSSTVTTDSVSLQRLDQLIALAHASDDANFEASTLKNPAKLEIWLRTVNRVNAPVNRGEAFAGGVPARKRCQCRKRPLASTVNMGQFHDQRAIFDPEAPE